MGRNEVSLDLIDLLVWEYKCAKQDISEQHSQGSDVISHKFTFYAALLQNEFPLKGQ